MNLRTAIATALFTLTLGACDNAAAPELGEMADRGPIGKADAAAGSCAPDEDGSVCGGPAPVGNCWCDEACSDFGDCCLDAFDECGVGEPEPAVSECLADEHCAPGQECAAGVCIGLPSCDDGSPLHFLCDMKPPCGEGEVAAVINGCFSCVDELTCEPAPEPEPESCDDGTQLSPFCDMKPLCDDGDVAAIIGSCFHCVDAMTCEA